jgi:hydrogenase/urease accessory protein HupE
MMSVGAPAGFAGKKLPLVEAVVPAPLLVIGGLLMGAVRMPLAWTAAVDGLNRRGRLHLAVP